MWEELQRDVETLARSVSASGEQFDLMVVIARGGMTIGHILSDFTGIPVAALTITTFTGTERARSARVSYGIEADLGGKRVLLVDDVSDSGATFAAAADYLRSHGVAVVKTAALYTKPWTAHVPDFSVRQFDNWIIYPYEVRETIESLHGIWSKDGVAADEMKRRLIELGIAEEYIERYMPHSGA